MHTEVVAGETVQGLGRVSSPRRKGECLRGRVDETGEGDS